MKKQTVLAKKKRGPPPTGKGEQVVVRMQPDPLAALDRWVAEQEDKPTRAEAIRRLVEMGLSIAQSSRKRTPKASTRAAELASGVIDSRMAADAPVEERQTRKERLVKGPLAFRDVRKDRSK